jgi:hypothetical protein
MATYGVSPVNELGQSNTEVLAQERVYSGEVLSAFYATNILEKFVTKKTLSHGLSMSFPITNVGKDEDVKTHIAGTEIDINSTNAGERIISLRDLEYDSRFIDNKQKKVLHWDITSPATKNLGQSLAQKMDKQLATLLKKAVKTEGVAGQPDGSWIYDADITDTALTAEERGNAHINAIFRANATMDTNNVPSDGRVYITDPMKWYDISQGTKVRSRDFTTKNGGIDVFSTEVIYIGNTMVLKSNNLDLSEDFIGYMFTKEAVGLVTFISIITESNYIPTRFGNLITARYCYGADVLNGGCVVGIRDANTVLS